MKTEKKKMVDFLRNTSKARYRSIKNQKDEKSKHISALQTILYDNNEGLPYSFKGWDTDDLATVRSIFDKYALINN